MKLPARIALTPITAKYQQPNSMGIIIIIIDRRNTYGGSDVHFDREILAGRTQGGIITTSGLEHPGSYFSTIQTSSPIALRRMETLRHCTADVRPLRTTTSMPNWKSQPSGHSKLPMRQRRECLQTRGNTSTTSCCS